MKVSLPMALGWDLDLCRAFLPKLFQDSLQSSPSSAGPRHSLHGLTCWALPRANAGALLKEEKQPNHRACSRSLP